MLKMMRHHAKYFYVLFFIVILTFIFWGVGKVDDSGQTTIIAEIGKNKITSEEYWRAYDNMFRFYRDLYKEKFDEEAQKKLKLKESVLDSLIENRVLIMAAEKTGVKISDAELNDAVKNEPAFMKNGVFDSQIYQNRLRLSRITPEAYEASKRQELVIKKMRRIIEATAVIPDEQLAGLSADEKTASALKEAIANDAKDKAIKSYVEGFKKGLKIKIYQDRIS